MEKILSTAATITIPFGAFQLARKASGHNGGPSYTTALSSFGGPFGMKGGIVTLMVIGKAAGFITEKSIEVILNSVVKQLCSEGESQEEIFAKIDKYPVSRDLKLKLKDTVQQYNFCSIEQYC
jgi:hypothetical protein